jgi:hypothetical protein
MSSPRNIALLAAGGIGIAVVAFLSGRRVEADASSSAGQANVSSTPLVSAHGAVAPAPSAIGSAAEDGEPAWDAGGLPAPRSPEDLFARLQGEKANRTKLEPSVDSVFAAMKGKGVEIDEELQVAAWMVGARYCDKVRTKKDVHVVVCEYTDEATAIQGAERSKSAVKHREILRNKSTTCAVQVPGDEKASNAEATKIKALFQSM